MKTNNIFIIALLTTFAFSSCKKKGCIDPSADNYAPEAQKDDGTCVYSELELPSTYAFTDENGNSTVSYGGQTERLDQMVVLSAYMRSGNANVLDLQDMKDMFSNKNDNGNGFFSFSTTKQLQNKCLSSDTSLVLDYFDSLAMASLDYAFLAEEGWAGTLNSDLGETYLFSPDGKEYAEIIEKLIMGGVFMYQATQVYFEDDKMNVDNSVAVDAAGGKHYTEMQHHWDEAFGYFGVPVNFPTTTSGTRYWGTACLNVDDYITCNTRMMNHFKRGRVAINESEYTIRDNEINSIRILWEEIAAREALAHLNRASNEIDATDIVDDRAKFFHELSMAYGYILSLKFMSLETRIISFSQIEDLLDNKLGNSFWDATSDKVESAKDKLESIYNF